MRHANRTEAYGYFWRLAFAFGRMVWILHRRFRCNNPACSGGRAGSKRRTLASISPRALSVLPTRVAERFEFISTVGGSAVHRDMVF